MPTFKDANGVERMLELNPLNVKQINEKFNIDLLDMVNGDLSARLSENIPALMNIIGDLAFPGVDEREAAQALADETVMENATKAFLKAIVGYLPDSTLLALCDDETAVEELVQIVS